MQHTASSSSSIAAGSTTASAAAAAAATRNRRRRRAAATDLPMGLFGAADWQNYSTTLGAMLNICVFTLLAGLVSFASQVQGQPLWVPPPANSSAVDGGDLTADQNTTLLLLLWPIVEFILGFFRCIIVSMLCTTHGELALLLATMLIALVDVERALGSIKLREALILLGIYRILMQAGINLLVGNPIWAMAPSAAWFGVCATVIRSLLIPPRRSFRLIGLPLSEQTACDIIALQLCLVSPDSWCALTSIAVSAISCSRWLPIHVRSRFFPAFWPNDVEIEDATVLVRFHPLVPQE